MILEIYNPLIVTVKILQGKNEGETVHVNTTLEELLSEDLSMQLINEGIFECICHPCDYYEVVAIEYKEADNG